VTYRGHAGILTTKGKGESLNHPEALIPGLFLAFAHGTPDKELQEFMGDC